MWGGGPDWALAKLRSLQHDRLGHLPHRIRSTRPRCQNVPPPCTCRSQRWALRPSSCCAIRSRARYRAVVTVRAHRRTAFGCPIVFAADVRPDADRVQRRRNAEHQLWRGEGCAEGENSDEGHWTPRPYHAPPSASKQCGGFPVAGRDRQSSARRGSHPLPSALVAAASRVRARVDDLVFPVFLDSLRGSKLCIGADVLITFRLPSPHPLCASRLLPASIEDRLRPGGRCASLRRRRLSEWRERRRRSPHRCSCAGTPSCLGRPDIAQNGNHRVPKSARARPVRPAWSNLRQTARH